MLISDVDAFPTFKPIEVENSIFNGLVASVILISTALLPLRFLRNDSSSFILKKTTLTEQKRQEKSVVAHFCCAGYLECGEKSNNVR